MKPPRRRWAGRSSGCAAIPTSSPSWSRRSTRTAAISGRPRSWSCSGRGRSSTSRAATSPRRSSTSANGRSRTATTILVSIADLHENADHLPGPRALRSVPLRRRQAPDVRLAAVRRRDPALHRRRLRQHRDGCGAANGVAALRHRDRRRPGREGAPPRRRLHAEGRRPRRGAPPQVVSAVVSNLVDMMNGAME